MTQPVRGTARERAAIPLMVVAGCVLPMIATLPLFQDVVWVFWLTAFALLVGALVRVLRIMRRERHSDES